MATGSMCGRALRPVCLLLTVSLLFATTALGQLGVKNLNRPNSNLAGTNAELTYPAIQLTSDPASSTNPKAAVDANFIYAVWVDTRDGNSEVYWRKLSLDGTPATGEVRVTYTSGSSAQPGIAIDGSGNSYLCWQEDLPYGTIYVAKLDNDGAVSVSPLAVSSNLCQDPEIDAGPAGNVVIAYHRRAASDQDVYLWFGDASLSQVCTRRFNDGTLPGVDKRPAVTMASNGAGLAAWYDLGTFFQDGIYVAGALPPTCGVTDFRRAINGDYDYPDMGYSGTFTWVVCEAGGNILNLYGTSSTAQVNDVSGTAHYPRVGDDPSIGYVVWQDSRDGNSEIYLSQAYGANTYTDVRLTEDAATSALPDIAMNNAVPGEWFVVFQDNRTGNNEIYLTTNRVIPASLVLLDDSPSPSPLADVEVALYRRNPDGSEDLIATPTANAAGVVTMDGGWFTENDVFRAEILAHIQATTRPHHDLVGGIAHEIFIDNGVIQEDGSFDYPTFQATPLQPVTIGHTLVKYRLLVGIEWDAEPENFDDLEVAFRRVANYMLDLTDGQATLGQVHFHDCGSQPDRQTVFNAADIKILASSDIGDANANWGYLGLNDDCLSGGVRLPRSIYAYDGIENLILTGVHGVNWSIREASVPFGESHYDPGVQGIAHELGHYLFYLGEEYRDAYPGNDPGCTNPAGSDPRYNFGLMYWVLRNAPSDAKYGEMSTPRDYTLAGTNFTHQWCANHESAWNKFESSIEEGVPGSCWTFPYDLTILIDTPEETSVDDTPIEGPNNDLENPEYDLGAQLVFSRDDFDSPGWFERTVSLVGIDKSLTKIECNVILKQTAASYAMLQGTCFGDTDFTILSAATGDTVLVFGTFNDSTDLQSTVAFGVAEVGSTGGDAIQVDMAPSPAEATEIASVWATGSGNMQLRTQHDPAVSSATVTFMPMGGSSTTENLFSLDSSFVSSPVISGPSGTILIQTMDSAAAISLSLVSYQWLPSVQNGGLGTVSDPDETCWLGLDPSIDSVVLSTFFGSVFRFGLPTSAIQASNVLSVHAVDEPTLLADGSKISLDYSLPAELLFMQDSLQVFEWDPATRTWTALVSSVDSIHSVVTAEIESLGTFAVFATSDKCCYGTTGNIDCDNDQNVSLTDLTLLVNHLFVTFDPLCCPEEANTSGDPQGDISLTDLTMLVNHLFVTFEPLAPCQ